MFKCLDAQILKCSDAKLWPIHMIQEALKSIQEHPGALQYFRVNQLLIKKEGHFDARAFQGIQEHQGASRRIQEHT